MGARLHSWWQQIKTHPVRTVLMALLAVVIVLIIVSILGYIFNWNWTGPEDEVRKIARVRTLTVLLGLDPIRKRSALQFLYGSGLIDKDQPIIELQGAKLREADLRHADLSGANMHGVDLLDANMRDAILDGVNPNKAFFTLAQLDSAKSHEGIDMSDAFVG